MRCACGIWRGSVREKSVRSEIPVPSKGFSIELRFSEFPFETGGLRIGNALSSLAPVQLAHA